MAVVAAVGAQQQSAAVVEPGEGAFDEPAFASELGAVLGLAACEQRSDPAFADEAAVLVGVVAAVGEQRVWPVTRPAGASAYRRHPVEQLEQLRDVVAVGGGQRPGERQPAAVYEQVVLAAAPAAVDRAGTRFRAPFFACR